MSGGDRVVYSSTRNVFVAPNRRGFGMVFQSYAIWPHMNVFQNAAFPLEVGDRKLSRKEIRDKVERVLKAVQLEEFADRDATKLSGGQQQPLTLPRAPRVRRGRSVVGRRFARRRRCHSFSASR